MVTAQESAQDASSAPVVSADVQSDSEAQRTTQPQRIQRKRTKGWRKPDGAIYVGRPSKWGNRWERGKYRFLTGKKAGQWAAAADIVRMFENALLHDEKAMAQARRELAGHDLMCWCKPGEPCHADVLLRVANGGGS